MVQTIESLRTSSSKEAAGAKVIKTLYGEFCPGQGYWLVMQRDGSRRVCASKRFQSTRSVQC